MLLSHCLLCKTFVNTVFINIEYLVFSFFTRAVYARKDIKSEKKKDSTVYKNVNILVNSVSLYI